MKKNILILFLLFLIIEMQAQEVSLPPKFFTLRNARICGGLGAELGHGPGNSTTNGLKKAVDSVNFDRFHLAFDLYAPNSFIGFSIEGIFELYDLSMHDTLYAERIITNSIEVPFFIKFRFGKITKACHWYIMPGASYFIPLQVNRKIHNLGNDNQIAQANGMKTLTNEFGIEVFWGERSDLKAKRPRGTWDRNRFALFVRYTYYIDSRFNADYYHNNNVKSIFNKFDNFIYKDQAVTIGAKYYFRLGRFNKGDKNNS